MDFLFASYDIKRKNQSTSFEEENPYAKTSEIIELAFRDKVAASKRLQQYMEKEWYKGHYSYGWRNAHKEPGYVGFWSFETAALAKILNLDDSSLKNSNRYPYDLAHYKNEMTFNLSAMKEMYSHMMSMNEKQEESEENIISGIEQDPNLEQIIPKKFHQYINQLIADYKQLSPSQFWKKYELQDIWFFEQEFIQGRSEKELLGTLIVFAMVEMGAILQLDYKEDLEDYMDNIPNGWKGQDVKLVRLELENDQNYYLYIPATIETNNLYEVKISNES